MPRRAGSTRFDKPEASSHSAILSLKNWLFFGSEEAGQRSAVIYTLIQNCRLHGVEPYTYLKDLLERLPDTTNRETNRLTPLKWKQGSVPKASEPRMDNA
jgi:transposase